MNKQNDIDNKVAANAKPIDNWTSSSISLPLTLTLTTLRPIWGDLKLPELKLSDFDFKKPSLTTRYTEEEICQAIEDNKGVKWLVAKKLGCSLFQLKKYLQTHPNASDLMKACEDGLVEFATAVIHDNLTSDDDNVRERAAEFVLKQYNDATKPPVQINIQSDEAKQIQIAAIFGLNN